MGPTLQMWFNEQSIIGVAPRSSQQMSSGSPPGTSCYHPHSLEVVTPLVMKLIDVTVPLDANLRPIRQHAVQLEANQANHPRRQLERLDAAHERAHRHSRRRPAPFFRWRGRRRPLPLELLSAAPGWSKSVARGIGPDELSGHRSVRRGAGAHQDRELAAVGIAGFQPDYVGRDRGRAPNIWSTRASRWSAWTTCRSSSSRTGRTGSPCAARRRHDRHRGAEPARRGAGVYEMFCLPLRIVGADGAPARVVLRQELTAMPALLDDSLVIVLAGGAGERLYPLTKDRAKPAVYFGGPVPHHRFRPEQLHQLRPAADLHRHAVQVALAQPPHPDGLEHRLGGARRVRRDPAAAEAGQRALVSGHGRRGLPEPLLDHAREPAVPDRAVGRSRLQDGLRPDAALPPGAQARRSRWRRSKCRSPRRSRFGIVAIDDAGARHRLPGEAEAIRARFRARRTSRSRRWASTSSTPTCSSARSRPTPTQPTAHDFGKDIIPALIHEVPVYAYRFYDENKKASKYWRDIGTLDAYFEANMDLCHVNPEFNLYDPEWPLRTYQPQAPPAKFVFAEDGQRCGQALDSVISPGCIVSGSTHLRQRALPERPRAQLLPHRAVHPDARRPRRAARADPAGDHRPRRAHPARRADRLRPRGGSAAPHGHRVRRRRRHDRRRTVHRAAQRRSAAVRGRSGSAGSGPDREAAARSPARTVQHARATE